MSEDDSNNEFERALANVSALQDAIVNKSGNHESFIEPETGVETKERPPTESKVDSHQYVPPRPNPPASPIQQNTKTESWIPWVLGAVFLAAVFSSNDEKTSVKETQKSRKEKTQSENYPTWRYDRDIETYHRSAGSIILRKEFNWGKIDLRNRCLPEEKGRICYTVIAVHKPSDQYIIPDLKGTDFDLSPDIFDFFGYVPIKQKYDLMGYEIKQLFKPGLAFAYTWTSGHDKPRTWKNIANIINSNPGLKILTCNYVSSQPDYTYHYTNYWFQKQPVGTDPEKLRSIDKDHPLLRIDSARDNCPIRFRAAKPL